MTLSSIWNAVKIFMGLSAAFALIAFGVFLLQISAQTKRTLAGVDIAVVQLVKDVDDLKVMTNATLFQAEEVLHHTDEVLSVEKVAQVEQLAKVNKVLDQLNTTVVNLDKTQAMIAGDVHNTMLTLPPVVEQVQSTLAKSSDAIVTLNQLEVNLLPTIQHINETSGHLDSMSASLDEVVKNAVKPKPWYKKIFGYVWAPIKIAALFAK